MKKSMGQPVCLHIIRVCIIKQHFLNDKKLDFYDFELSASK